MAFSTMLVWLTRDGFYEVDRGQKKTLPLLLCYRRVERTRAGNKCAVQPGIVIDGGEPRDQGKLHGESVLLALGQERSDPALR